MLGKHSLGKKQGLTLMYVLVPTKVLAMELMASPETPKSQILISPLELNRMLEGLMSISSTIKKCPSHVQMDRLTTMDDAVHIVKIGEAFENGDSNLANHLDVNGTMLLVDAVE